MKKLYTIILALAFISLSAVQADGQQRLRSSNFVGTLAVDMTTMGLGKTSNDEQVVTVTPTSYGLCTIAIYDFTFGGENLGDIIMDNVKLTDGTDGGLNFEGSKDGVTLADGNIIADVSCNGTEDVYGNLSLNITVKWGDTILPVTFTGKYSEAGITDTSNDGQPVEFYSINGQKYNSNNLRPGLYIVKRGINSSKVIIR